MSGTDVSRQVSRSLRQLAVSNVAPSDTPVSPTKPLVEARDVGGGRPPRTPTIVAATRFASPALVAFRELQRYDVSTPLGTLPDARELPNSHVETKPSPHICERYLTQTMASFATDRWLLVHRSSIDDDDDLPVREGASAYPVHVDIALAGIGPHRRYRPRTCRRERGEDAPPHGSPRLNRVLTGS